MGRHRPSPLARLSITRGAGASALHVKTFSRVQRAAGQVRVGPHCPGRATIRGRLRSRGYEAANRVQRSTPGRNGRSSGGGVGAVGRMSPCFERGRLRASWTPIPLRGAEGSDPRWNMNNPISPDQADIP